MFDASLLKGTGMKVSVDVNNGNTDNFLDSPRIAFLGYRCVAGMSVYANSVSCSIYCHDTILMSL